jgi:anti-sigma regulatory factor (Ser/Thr protein kinase)
MFACWLPGYRRHLRQKMEHCSMSADDGQFEVTHGGHAVQFYADDAELSGSAVSYLDEGLSAGGSAVVVATEAHRSGLRAGLAAAGGDGGAGPGSRLITRDAAGMLGGFMAGGRFDYPRFQATAEALVNSAAGAGQPVRIYAELVTLLWDAGQVTLALELETMWNDLALLLPFSLLCGYPARVAAPDGDTGAVAQVCRLHTGVIAPSLELRCLPGASSDGNEAVRSFPGAMESVRAARVFVTGQLDPWAANAVAADAAIVIAELASNAVLHARTPFTVAVSWWPDRVRIAVRDAVPLPDDGDGRMMRTPGHGLDLVARIARSWAVEPLADGKVVWAELSRPNVHLVV